MLRWLATRIRFARRERRGPSAMCWLSGTRRKRPPYTISRAPNRDDDRQGLNKDAVSTSHDEYCVADEKDRNHKIDQQNGRLGTSARTTIKHGGKNIRRCDYQHPDTDDRSGVAERAEVL